MKFHSTRGRSKNISFEEVILSGYANDGGMLLPDSYPSVSTETLKVWKNLSYIDLAFEVMSLYIDENDIPKENLKDILRNSYSKIDARDVVPIKHMSSGLYIAELYHGRSLAFKDLAMTCMGNFYNYFLAKNKKHISLVVATSGDTGSSAIEAVRGSPNIDVVVLLPRNRITRIQEQQMTTVMDSNVHVFRVDGTSDDADVVVRNIFSDSEFVSNNGVGSCSSLNFGRIVTQIVHIFWAYLKLCTDFSSEVEMIFPTGGGGNVTAAIIAQKMGLPIKLVCAVNSNNMLSRVMSSGECQLLPIHKTLAPAMDIQFAYNFERIWYLLGHEADQAIRDIMTKVDKGLVSLPNNILSKMKDTIEVYSVEDDEIKATIRRCWDEDQYHICPHTAIGVAYFYSMVDKKGSKSSGAVSKPSVVFATASPLKFPEAIEASGVPTLSSKKISDILEAPTRYVDLEKTQNWTKEIKSKLENITKSISQS